MEKRVNLLQPLEYAGKKQLWKILGPAKNYGKQRLKSHPANVEPVRGNANYLSKLDLLFFHYSVGHHIYIQDGHF